MVTTNKKLLFKGILFVVIFSIAFFATKYIISYLISAEEVVKEISSNINSKCPLMINSDIRLDKTDVISVQNNFGLVYVCTLVNEDERNEKLNPTLLDKETKLAAKKDYDLNPELEYLRKEDLIVYYVCYDKNKKHILGFEVYNSKR